MSSECLQETDGLQVLSLCFSALETIWSRVPGKIYNKVLTWKQQVQASDRSLSLASHGNKGKSRFHNKWNVITVTAILKWFDWLTLDLIALF